MTKIFQLPKKLWITAVWKMYHLNNATRPHAVCTTPHKTTSGLGLRTKLHFLLLTECICDGGVHRSRGGDKLDFIEVWDKEMITDVSEAVLPRRGAKETLDQPDKQDHDWAGQGRKLLKGTFLRSENLYTCTLYSVHEIQASDVLFTLSAGIYCHWELNSHFPPYWWVSY